MKNCYYLISMLIIAFIIDTSAQSAGKPCIEDFDNIIQHELQQWNWFAINGSVSIIDTMVIAAPSKVLLGCDKPGGSWMINDIDYRGNWYKQYVNDELCFDILYDPMDNTKSLGYEVITIYNKNGNAIFNPYDPGQKRAIFQLNSDNGVGHH